MYYCDRSFLRRPDADDDLEDIEDLDLLDDVLRLCGDTPLSPLLPFYDLYLIISRPLFVLIGYIRPVFDEVSDRKSELALLLIS